MKKRYKKLSALLLACMMTCIPVSDAYAAVTHNVAETGVMDGQLLFPGDSMTGITAPAVFVGDEPAELTEGGTWTNEKKKKVYRATLAEDGSGALIFKSEGYKIEIIDGISEYHDQEIQAEADNHYEFPEEEKPAEGKLHDIACYAEGDLVKITAAEPAEGMQFAGWTTDAEEFTLPDPMSAVSTFEMPKDSFTITANYAPAAPTVYNVTVNNGEGSGTYEVGSQVSVTAWDRSSENLIFNGWSVDTANVSMDTTAAAGAFAMVEGDVVLTATYVEAPPAVYTVTVNNGEGSGSYEAGATVNVTAWDRSSENLIFNGWSVDTANVSMDTTAAAGAFAMVEGDVVLTATYVEAPPAVYTVTVNNGEGSGSYEAGATVSAAAWDRTGEGLAFAGWFADSGNISISDVMAGTVEFIMPEGEVVITATYEEIPAETEAPAEVITEAVTETQTETTVTEAQTETTVTEAQTETTVTEAPTTEAPVTEAPVTEAPATEAPVTEAPVTEAPATEAPVTEAPATEAPATETPVTEAPVTEAPVTEAPATETPVTEAPVTEAPATEAPATETIVIEPETSAETIIDIQISETQPAEEVIDLQAPAQSETQLQSETQPQSETAVQTYAVTVENGLGGGEYAAGTVVTIEAVIEPGKAFSQWTTDSTAIVIDYPTQPIASFVMPAEPVTVSAVTATATYRVTMENAVDQNGAAEAVYAVKDTVTVTAAEAPLGMEFKGFEGTVTAGGVTTALIFADAASASTTFEMPQGDVMVKAVYAELPKTYLVKVSNGLINNSVAEIAVEEGTQITLEANPCPYGQQFSKWTVNDGAYDLGENTFKSSITVTVTENMNFLAVYEGIEYTVEVEDGYSDYEQCVVGTVVTITADEAPKGMRFDYWEVHTPYAELEDEYSEETTFVMPDGNVSVSAVYKRVKYEVTVQNGTTDQEYYYYGDTVTVTSKYPASGRVFDVWTSESGKAEFADASRWKTTFEMPARNVTVAANYKDGPSVNDNLILDIVSGGEYIIGNTIKFSASGAGMSNSNPNPGDYRYRPSGYQIGNVTGTWKAEPYTTSMAINAAGEYTLKVIYNKDIYNGSTWVSEGTSDAKAVTFRVVTEAAGVATGDETPIVLIIAIASVSCVLFIVLLLVVILRRRKK